MADFAIGDIFTTLDKLAPQYGIDPATAKSLIIAENTSDGSFKKKATFSGDATNSNRTMGIGQVIPTTARGLQQAGLLRPDWKFDPNDLPSQLEASLATMKDMKSRLRNPDDPFELGAYYNGGTEAWKGYQAGRPLNPETTTYLKKQRNGMAELGINMTPQQIERAAGAGAATPTGTSGSGSSYRTTTRSNVYDSGALDAFNRTSGLMTDPGGILDTAVGGMQQRQTGMENAGIDLIASIAKAAQDAGTAAMTQTAVTGAAAATRAGILTRANLHPEQNMNRVDQALQALDETSARLDQLRPEIDARTSVGFFDNPLEYLVNQTRLPGMVAGYNNLVQVQQDQLGKYEAAKNIATSAISMSQGIEADEILAAGAAQAQAIASNAVKEQRQVQMQLASKASADALAAVQMGNAAVDITYKQLMITKQQEAVSEGMTERQAQKAAEDKILTDLNLLVKAAGGQGIDMTRFKSLPPKVRDDLVKSMSTRKFGSDFVDSLKFINEFGNLDAMAEGGQLAVRTWVNDTRRAASEVVNQEQIKANAPGSATAKTFNPAKAMENTLAAQAAQYEAASNVNMRGAKQGNPYRIDYPSILKDPTFATNVWAQQMAKYGPKGTEPILDSFDEQQFMNKAITNIRISQNAPEMTKKYAADIAAFYQAAAKKTADTTKYSLFGLAKPEKIYPVILSQYGTKPTTIDLGDPTQVENLLTKQVAYEIRANNPFTLEGAQRQPFGLIR